MTNPGLTAEARALWSALNERREQEQILKDMGLVKTNSSWWDDNCDVIMKKRIDLRQKLMRDPTPETREAFNKCKKETKKMLKKYKKEKLKKRAEEAAAEAAAAAAAAETATTAETAPPNAATEATTSSQSTESTDGPVTQEQIKSILTELEALKREIVLLKSHKDLHPRA